MFRKDQFGIVFNTIFSLMFAIFLPLYIDGSNMFREAGAILWGPLVQQLTKDFIPGFAVAFAIGTYIDLKAMGDGFARLCGVKNENGLLFHILRVASITFVMAVLMSLVMMFLAVGYTMPAGAFFMAYLMSFPPDLRGGPGGGVHHLRLRYAADHRAVPEAPQDAGPSLIKQRSGRTSFGCAWIHFQGGTLCQFPFTPKARRTRAISRTWRSWASAI